MISVVSYLNLSFIFSINYLLKFENEKHLFINELIDKCRYVKNNDWRNSWLNDKDIIKEV